jgi:colanic acid biosynthesis glycosyl transferase WcaI
MIGSDRKSGSEGPQRILVIHRYYWPDTPPCASLMRSIVAHLREEGHEVEVLTSQPSYRPGAEKQQRPHVEHVDGVRVERLRLPTEVGRPLTRITNALRLGPAIVRRALTRRYDVILVTSIPPVLGGFFAALAARLSRARLIYYCMDLHPEIGRVSGDFANPILYRVLQALDSWSCRQARPVLVHSEDMRQTLRERPRGDEPRIELLNNFALPSCDSGATELELGTEGNRLTVIYAGNIGRFQGLETAVDAMAQLRERRDIELIIMGDGVARESLIERVQQSGANVRFLAHQPVEVAKSAIRQADIGLVTLVPGIYRYAYPSKTMAYLEQGRPIIAAVEPESELAMTMAERGYGLTVPSGDVSAMTERLVELADDSQWKEPMNQAAREAFDSEFSAPVVLNRWSRVLSTNHPQERCAQ